VCFQGPPAQADYLLTTSRACNGAGFRGTAENLNARISFEACRTTQGYHALIRDSNDNVLLELYYDTPTEQVVYLIDGIEVSDTEEHTPDEVARKVTYS